MNNRQTLLVVDDEPDVLKLLEMELTQEGYIVLKAICGQEACRKAELYLPDLIVLDILLPDMNGGQVLQELKLNQKTRQIPVIFLTAVMSREEEKNKHLRVAIDQDFYPAIAKPFDVTDLFRDISDLLHKTQREA